MGLFRSIAVGLLVLAIPVALIATNVRFAASEPRVYDYSVREYAAADVSGIPQPELLRANRELVRYFKSDDGLPLSITVKNSGGREVSLFNARETAHLADVRDLFRRVFTVQQIAVAAVLSLAVLVMVSAGVRALAGALLYGSLLTVGLIGLTGVLAAAAFDDAWTRFHLFAFANDLWRLNPATDRLIQMFPEGFWMDITLLIGAFTALEALVLASISGAYLYSTRLGLALERAAVGPPRPLPPPVPSPRVPPPRPRHLAH